MDGERASVGFLLMRVKESEEYERLVEKVEENESEDEGIEDYKIGGYHTVFIG